MHQVKEDQKLSSEPKLRPVELDCGKTHHLQRRESRRGHDATRHVTRSQRQISAMYAPAVRLHGWLGSGLETLHAVLCAWAQKEGNKKNSSPTVSVQCSVSCSVILAPPLGHACTDQLASTCKRLCHRLRREATCNKNKRNLFKAQANT